VGMEIDLMRNYPKIAGRLHKRPFITDTDREISRLFGKDYFDGQRKHGYGGFQYHPKFWSETVKDFANHYSLKPDAYILDVGCAKGFMLKDFKRLLPNSTLLGVDISEYAIRNSDPEVAESLILGSAVDLPFHDKSFDLVISINTIHNLERSDCIKALAEVQRVSRGNSFVMVDGWRTESEREALESWVLTARTLLSANQWIELFQEAKYLGDYAFWTV
jgi:ubiquinone/menaquinone biosynthesis C-methylase UbiE